MPDRRAASGRISGGLALPRDVEWRATGRHFKSPALQHLPEPTGQVCRDNTPALLNNRGDRRRPYLPYKCGCTRPSGSWRRRDSGKEPGRCAGNCNGTPLPATRTIRTTGGCTTSATRTYADVGISPLTAAVGDHAALGQSALASGGARASLRGIIRGARGCSVPALVRSGRRAVHRGKWPDHSIVDGYHPDLPAPRRFRLTLPANEIFRGAGPACRRSRSVG